MSRSQPDSRVLPASLVVVAVVILVGVAAATSHTSVWAPARDGVGYVSELLTIVAVSFAATLAAAGAYLSWGRRPAQAAWRTVLPPTVIVAVLISLLGISRAELHLEAPVPGIDRNDESGGGRLGIRLRNDWRGPAVRNADEAPGTEGGLPPGFGRELLMRVSLVLVAVLALVLVAGMRRGGRRGPGLSGEWDARAGRTRKAAHRAVVHSIDAMLADPDHRTAIIGAYARLLDELEAIGASRRTYEGPTEHLRRVLSMLDIGPGPLRALVELFEVARFSEHSLTGVHRDQAVAALRAVAESLSAPARPHTA
jgi:hypothetical protein